MGKGKKSFINRNNAVTFNLVHRSQHDPLVVDESAPQRVLVEAPSLNQQQKSLNKEKDPTKRREEQLKYGINFDDDYNYLQHLKKPDQDVVWEYVENPNQVRKGIEGQVTTAPKLNLPSSIFASEFEEDEGMLNRAAPRTGPRPDWDPDIVAALDDDFDYNDAENMLEDDFIVKAMEAGEDDKNGDNWSDDNDKDIDSDDFSKNESELIDKLGPLIRDCRFREEETKSRFTEYSMSSSVIRRNEQLSLLDDRFDRFYANYDDPELGDLACEEIEGVWHQKHPFVLNCYEQLKKSKEIGDYKKEWDKERINKYRNVFDCEEDPSEEMVELDVENPKTKKWDCESVLSNYSNIYNHPKLIEEPYQKSTKNSSSSGGHQLGNIDIDPKTELPVNVLRNPSNNQLTERALAKLNSGAYACTGPKSLCNKSLTSTLSVLSLRPKDETPEEKHERKRLFKEYRSERRIEKKLNTEAFKEEKKRQTHIKINQKCNQQGNKIL